MKNANLELGPQKQAEMQSKEEVIIKIVDSILELLIAIKHAAVFAFPAKCGDICGRGKRKSSSVNHIIYPKKLLACTTLSGQN